MCVCVCACVRACVRVHHVLHVHICYVGVWVDVGVWVWVGECTCTCLYVPTYVHIMAYIHAGKVVKKMNVGCVLTCRNLKV